jgi:EipB-like
MSFSSRPFLPFDARKICAARAQVFADRMFTCKAARAGERGCGRPPTPLCSAAGQGRCRRLDSMTRSTHRLPVLCATVAAVSALAFDALPTPAQAAGNEFVAHRAIYELNLATTRGKSTVAARGRILYDFTGSVCEGYTLDFRQVSQLDNGEGKVTLSDLRSHTFEDGAAKTYAFRSENYLNQRLVDNVDGKAERQASAIAVKLTKPKDKNVDLDATIVFPTEHVRRIIDAARAGKTILEFPVFDGSETGEKVYNTLTVIGREIGPDRAVSDAAAGKKELAGMKRWPVTVSYFDRTGKSGEQVPVYAIGFELYENGISRALMLDYNDFSIGGVLTTLDIKDSKPCP